MQRSNTVDLCRVIAIATGSCTECSAEHAQLDDKKEKKSKTRQPGMIQEKLMLDPGCLLAQANTWGGRERAGGEAEGSRWSNSSVVLLTCHHGSGS